MGKTSIGWTDETWNPVRGCSRVSEGCRHCYAEVQAERIVRMGKGKPTPYDGLVKLVNGEPRWTGEIAIDARRLAAPLHWRAPRRVFVDSMSDLFYDKRPDEHIAAVFGVMAATPHITYQILTKYARRMREWFAWADNDVARSDWMRDPRRPDAAPAIHHVMEWLGRTMPPGFTFREGVSNAWPLPNVWLGVSTENQETYIERVRQLHHVPAAVHFISAEPLLSAIDMSADSINPAWLDQVIVGCESGAEARPAEDAWFDSIAAQCRAAGVPLFVKQMMVGGKLVTDVDDLPIGLRSQEFPHG
jgi:protein gp37